MRSRALLPSRTLTAARMVGAALAPALGQVAVDMPDGYFGATDTVTAIGAGFALFVLVGNVACSAGTLLGHRWPAFAFPVLASIAIGAFVPAVPTDPTTASAVILWQLAVLGQLVAPLRTGDERKARRGGSAVDPVLGLFRPTLQHLVFIALALTVAVVGFRLTEHTLPEVVCLVVDLSVLALASPFLVAEARRSRRGFVVVVGAAGLVAAGATLLPITGRLGPVLGILGLAHAALYVLLLARGPLLVELIEHFFARPALLVLSSFAFVIVAGGIVLTFPVSAAGDARIGALDALFTSTSAVCVTGLIVLDTPVAFSAFGHAAILLLIQIGGLGIMVLSTFATVLLGGRLGLRGEHALEEMLELASPASAYRLTRFIIASTLAIEALGAGILAIRFHAHGVPWGEAVWQGTFHAISAFCNAGFALYSDSIMQFQTDGTVVLVHAVLITLGGLGFVVLAWGWRRIVRLEKSRASVQVDVVLRTSLVLVVLGTVGYGLLEWNVTLAGLSFEDKLWNAVFQSVTTRTAGFNSVDVTKMAPATVLLVIAWMFIGASPGGTGGGIKTTTLAVLFAAIPGIARGEARATIGRREVPLIVVLRATTIFVVALMVATIAMFVLLATHDLPFVTLAFEVVSALGTVGLSMGATPLLEPVGKVVIIVTMFVGRVGPLTLALLLGRGRPSPVGYPETRIMVG